MHKAGDNAVEKGGLIAVIAVALFWLVMGTRVIYQAMRKPKVKDAANVWKQIKYFQPDEFDSKDQPGSGFKMMQPDFLVKLDAVRDEAGIPFIITSGYRSGYWNEKVGGVKSSEHMIGYAADINFTTPKEAMIIINAAKKIGFVRIGLYWDDRDADPKKWKSFVHLGCSPDHPKSGWGQWRGKSVKLNDCINKIQTQAKTV